MLAKLEERQQGRLQRAKGEQHKDTLGCMLVFHLPHAMANFSFFSTHPLRRKKKSLQKYVGDFLCVLHALHNFKRVVDVRRNI